MRNLKEARVKIVTQTKVNLRKAGSEGKIAQIIKAQYSLRNRFMY